MPMTQTEGNKDKARQFRTVLLTFETLCDVWYQLFEEQFQTCVRFRIGICHIISSTRMYAKILETDAPDER